MTFDMKAARHHAVTGDLMKTTEWLYAALDEIERLQRENLELNVATMGPDQTRAHQGCVIEEQATRILELEGIGGKECDTRENAIRARDNYYQEIQRLLRNKEKDASFWNEQFDEQQKTIDKQRAALKKLGRKYQELIRSLRNRPGRCDLYGKKHKSILVLGRKYRRRGKKLVEERAARVAYENNMQLCECEEWARCQARRQLRQEGKL